MSDVEKRLRRAELRVLRTAIEFDARSHCRGPEGETLTNISIQVELRQAVDVLERARGAAGRPHPEIERTWSVPEHRLAAAHMAIGALEALVERRGAKELDHARRVIALANGDFAEPQR